MWNLCLSAWAHRWSTLVRPRLGGLLKDTSEEGGWREEERIRREAFTQHILTDRAAVWSAVWKCSISAPEAPDKDVLMFSLDRAHVSFLICEPDGGSRQACLACYHPSYRTPGVAKTAEVIKYIHGACGDTFILPSPISPFVTSPSPSLTHAAIPKLPHCERICHWPSLAAAPLLEALINMYCGSVCLVDIPSVCLFMSTSSHSISRLLLPAYLLSFFVTQVSSCPP